MLTTRQKIERIQEGLAARGRPSTLSDVAQILNVNPSTVWRWMATDKRHVEPRGKQAEGIEILYRSLVKAEQGDPAAEQVLGAILGGAAAGLLGLGMGAVLIGMGVGWLFGEFAEEENKKKKGKGGRNTS